MIHIAICDDEEIAVQLIQESITAAFKQYKEDIEIHTFLSGSGLRSAILHDRHFDAIFLDINMPDMDGIFLARHLKALMSDTLIIFVSSQEEKVFHSLSASPFRFLRKNMLEQEMPQTIRDMITTLKEREPQNIVLKFRQSYISLNPYRVIYIESQRKQQIVHTPEQNYEVNCRLKQLEEQFAPFGFLKPHNSYLVNYRFIASIQQTELILDNKERIPVSRHRLSDLKKEYLNLISV